jgi:hypothetical protein
VKFTDVLRRITGVSTPVFGISWNPPVSEREEVRKLIVYLEDRRALIYPLKSLAAHNPWGIVDSVLEMRRQMTLVLQQLPENSTGALHIRAMRAACLKFLDTAETVPIAPIGWRKYDPRER